MNAPLADDNKSALDRAWAKHLQDTTSDRSTWDCFNAGWKAGIQSTRFMSRVAAHWTFRAIEVEDLLREALTICSDANAAGLARRIEETLADQAKVKVFTCTLCGGTVDLSNPVRPTA